MSQTTYVVEHDYPTLDDFKRELSQKPTIELLDIFDSIERPSTFPKTDYDIAANKVLGFIAKELNSRTKI